jgi:hypothetical protein
VKEHRDLLQALPQRIHADSANRHENLVARNVEVIALLKGLSDTLSQLSKDTDGLKGAVAKVDSGLAGEHAAIANRFTVSEQSDSSVRQVRLLFDTFSRISLTHMLRVLRRSEKRLRLSASVCFPSLLPAVPRMPPFRSNL